MNYSREEERIHDFVSKMITGRIAENKGGAVFLFGTPVPSAGATGQAGLTEFNP